MKYFIDTEFLEGPQRHRKTFLGVLLATKKYTEPTIDLISIGIVAEDGREYYAISKDFNLKEAWNKWQPKQYINTVPYGKNYWIRDNVLKPIFDEFYIDSFGCKMPLFNYNTMKVLIDKCGKTNKQIAEEIKDFISMKEYYENTLGYPKARECYDGRIEVLKKQNKLPIFYGYYADYDWVVFCWLFGRMMDLPDGFPMYCIDLKQSLDEQAYKELPGLSKEEAVKTWKTRKNYPKQINEHNALSDARWNKQLYEFLNTL